MRLSELMHALECAQDKLHPGSDPEVVFQEGVWPDVSGTYHFDSVRVELNPANRNDEGRVMIVQT